MRAFHAQGAKVGFCDIDRAAGAALASLLGGEHPALFVPCDVTDTAALAAAIDEYFGSFDQFQAHFTAAALGIQGSGWAVLAYEPIGGNLVIEQFYDQQNGVPVATIPLFQLDMWEHAFYLDYQNVKADYVKAIWNIVNWADVQARFEAARAGASGLILPA